MQVVCRNYVENQQLYHAFDEPLFLKPDDNRTRYCIGWNGKGRYLPGTLKVTYNGLPCNITEEDNGIFYNFSVAPGSNTNYDDYTVTYTARPLDYAFATGDSLGGYPNEEYFLFPNWNNAKGEGNAFWVSRWFTNITDNIPYSIKCKYIAMNVSLDNFKTYCDNKGDSFHNLRNREFCSLILWADHMGIEWRGNVTEINSGTGLDGYGTILPDNCLGDGNGNGHRIVDYSGYAPATWYHNHNKDTGIESLYGNKMIVLDGLKSINGEWYILDENNEDYIPTGINQIASQGSAKNFTALCNANDLLNECLPVDDDYEGSKFYPTLIGSSANINESDNNPAFRIVWSGFFGKYSGTDCLGMFSVGGNSKFDQNHTVRLVRDLID